MKTIKFLVTLFLAINATVITNAQKKHFNGEITYTVSVSLNKAARKIIKGTEGEYKVRTICKNGNEKTTENYYMTTSYTFRDKDSIYSYNQRTRTGYKCSLSETIKYNEKVRKEGENKAGGVSTDFKNDVKPTGETKEISGLMFQRYSGTQTFKMDVLGAKVVSTEDLDYWVNTDYDESSIMTIMIPGLFTDLRYTSRFKVPLLGEVEQHITMAFHKVKPRDVSDEEMALPSDIDFKELKNDSEISSAIKKDYKKWAKAQGKKQGEEVKTEGAAEIEGEWEF